MQRKKVMRLAVAALILAVLFGWAVERHPAAVDTLAESADAAVTEMQSLFARGAVWLTMQQNRLHRELAGDLRRVSSEGNPAAALILVATSFLYGVFHAVGPGHGKILLSAYLFADERRSRDGVWLAVVAAFVQGLVAVLLVYGLIMLVGMVSLNTQVVVAWTERASFALVTLVGAALILRIAGRHLRAARHAPRHGHGHGGHVHDEHCGHVHVPNEAQLAGARDFSTRLVLVLSIGLRPCTGAVLVLILAQAAGIGVAGIAAVAAMSTGTAIAIGAIAFVAMNARPLALKLLGRANERLDMAMDVLAAVGGIAVVAIGGFLLAGSFAPAHPLGY